MNSPEEHPQAVLPCSARQTAQHPLRAAEAARQMAARRVFRRTRAVGLLLLASCVLAACESDVRPRTDGSDGTSGEGVVMGDLMPQPGMVASETNGSYAIESSNASLAITEGGDPAGLTISIQRSDGHRRPVTLAIEAVAADSADNLIWQFDTTQFFGTDVSTELRFQLGYDTLPILPQNRQLNLVATDGRSPAVVVPLTLQVTPTPLPDVYLLAGQSNMVGSSEDNAKRTGPGEADETNPRILQLNVTGNDGENFDTAADFTNVDRIAVSSPRFVDALDPLHDGFDVTNNGKAGTRIGLGLSFAKQALQQTTASIYLVPTGWSDTGFCRRDTNAIAGLGWNAQAPSNPALSGTLLHDRAIARTNIVLSETTGILRGILWHQGEADSDDAACANTYAENLQAMVQSLRNNIQLDPRGARARGSSSDVPFVLGTMSRGNDERGDFSDFVPEKQQVDNVHRGIDNLLPHAGFVNNDDLVPPAFPCGEGFCIHFGSQAYREMGVRYFDQLQAVVNR